MRFTFVWRSAPRLPTANDAITIAAEADLPHVGLARERRHQHPQREHERHHLGRGRHERGHRRRRALVGVGRPHVERRGVGLEAEADDHHREAHEREHVVRVALREPGADAVELELAARAVGERRAVEQEGGARPTRRSGTSGRPRARAGRRSRSRRARTARARTARARRTPSRSCWPRTGATCRRSRVRSSTWYSTLRSRRCPIPHEIGDRQRAPRRRSSIRAPCPNASIRSVWSNGARAASLKAVAV